jgi:hypothetical protein
MSQLIEASQEEVQNKISSQIGSPSQEEVKNKTSSQIGSLSVSIPGNVSSPDLPTSLASPKRSPSTDPFSDYFSSEYEATSTLPEGHVFTAPSADSSIVHASKGKSPSSTKTYGCGGTELAVGMDPNDSACNSLSNSVASLRTFSPPLSPPSSQGGEKKKKYDDEDKK